MDHAACHVLYVDNRSPRDGYVKRSGAASPGASSVQSGSTGYFDPMLENEEVQENVQNILSTFPGVYVCMSGTSCKIKLAELNESIETELKPTIVILDVPLDLSTETREVSTPSPTSRRKDLSAPAEGKDVYGLALLQHLSAEIASSNLSPLVLPIAMTTTRDTELSTQSSADVRRYGSSAQDVNTRSGSVTSISHSRKSLDPSAPVDPKRMVKFLDAGAVDVLTSPLQKDRVYGLTAHAYRAHKGASKDQTAFLATKRFRKRSWVGVEDGQPYGYLRESMVSNLMTSICKPEAELNNVDPSSLNALSGDRAATVAQAIGTWNFSTHDFSDDELMHAAFLMLQHALSMQELQQWRISANDLKSFLMTCRAAYNSFVLYHNFRHVVDVLQSVFYFLVQLGTLPPYPADSAPSRKTRPVSPIAALLRPFDAMMLLIAAIGHDVGHPGVNNAFLVALKAPLAQLYNDNSVLEAFHCAAYSQILRRYWRVVFDDTTLRRLLIKSILATDMGVHFKYMSDLGNLQEKLHDNKGTDGWSEKVLEEHRTLACGLLIKCADISNVARPFDVAAKWSNILQCEFAKQGEMEKDVGIPTTLFGGPPELGNTIKLANSQIGFMNIFAKPLYESVSDVMPAMHFAVSEINKNQEIWKAKIAQEKGKEPDAERNKKPSEDLRSPLSDSPKYLGIRTDISPTKGMVSDRLSPCFPPFSSSSPQQSSFLGGPRRSSLSSITPFFASSTTSQTRDPSRRSSIGNSPTSPSFPTDPRLSSRRSSSALPAVNTLPSRFAAKQLSNVMSSPPQAGGEVTKSTGGVSRKASSPATSEDAQAPSSASLDESTRPTTAYTPAGSSAGAGSSRHGSKDSSAGQSSTRHGSKDSDAESSTMKSRQHSSRYSGQPANGRHSASAVSSRQDRYSTGTHTLTNQHPGSPTDAQAKSFFTDGSDEKYYPGENEPGMPKTVDIEQPGSDHNSSIVSDKGSEVKTSVNGVNSVNGSAVSSTVSVPDISQKSVRKKGSRFRLDFWKRRGKASAESSP